ncbi:Ig-like domain-containing protein [Ferrimonas balearica]|uniref:Ig-like domain-containing protein n=1 Tax=Ferrimonas balearica TaxID=44012 RepID=UPI001C94936D|nr:Ig-like domain-containing protein [Ferrimonas balearica]MBY5981317.1 tandem-95 repeat protein [Ferrimonas balearica]
MATDWQKRHGLVLCAALFSFELSAAPIVLNGPSSGWIPVLAGARFDPIDDEQAQTTGLDLVGDAQHPQFYTVYDDNNSVDESDDVVAYRFRVGSGNDSNVYLMGVDSDGDAVLDIFIAGSGKEGKIYIWGSDDKKNIPAGRVANDGPSTTTIDTKNPPYEIATGPQNYSLNPVSSVDSDASTTDFGPLDGEDHFVSFTLPFSAIKSALNSVKGQVVSKDTTLRYVVFSLNQTNSINGDFSGINDKDPGVYDKTYEELGLFVPVAPDYVPPSNEAPIAVADTASTLEDSSVLVDVLIGDSDPDGDPLTIIGFTQPAFGIVTQEGEQLRYAPSLNFHGNDSFTYTISDDGGLSHSAAVAITVTPVNDAPVANYVEKTIAEGASLVVAMTELGSDVDGDALTLALGALPEGWNHTVTASSVTIIPPVDFNGSQNIGFTVTDPAGLSDGNTIKVIVTPVNDAPVAMDDSTRTSEETAVNIDVTANDSDADGDALRVESISNLDSAKGSATFSGGTITFTPAQDVTGEVSFSYTVTDGSVGATGLTDTATVTVTIDPVNDAPVAMNDSVRTAEETAVNIDVTANDSDADGDALRVESISNLDPAKGSATFSGGTITFTPAKDETGEVSFSYTVTDGAVGATGLTDTATVTVTIDPVNDAPQANDLSRTIEAGASLTVPVSELAKDADGDALDFTFVTLPQGWTAKVEGGNVVVTPVADFSGSQGVEFTVADPSGAQASATITITVNRVNEAPVANNISRTIAEDSSLTVAVSVLASDPDGDAFELTFGTLPQGWVAKVEGGNVVVTPPTDFNGSEPIPFTVTDPSGAEAAAVITVTVEPGNDAPVAVDDTATTTEDTPVAIDILRNDSDVDGDALYFNGVTGLAADKGRADFANGVLTFTPAAHVFGEIRFDYTISDGDNGQTDSASVTVTVDPVNDAPVAVADSTTTEVGSPVVIPVLDNDSDVDGDALKVISVVLGDPAQGSVSFSDNSITFTPAAGFIGNASLTYTIADPSGAEASANVSVQVVAADSEPVAVDDEASVNEDESVQIRVLNNDSHGGAGLNPASVQVVDAPLHGEVSVDVGSGVITYRPTENYDGSDSFTYQVQDNGERVSAPATVRIEVLPVNDAPVAVNDTFDVTEDGEVLLTLLNNDSDPDSGDAPQQDSIEFLSQPEQGTLTLRDGQWYFQPEANQTASVEFEYRVADGEGVYSDGARVFVRIEAVNDAPVARADEASTDEDTALLLDLLTNDEDVDGQLLPGQIEITVPPTSGTVSQDSEGNWYYTPNPNASGQDSFEYRLVDEEGLASESVVVTVTINAVNDIPVANDDAVTLAEDGDFAINVLGNDEDIDGVLLAASVTVVAQPEHGTVELDRTTGLLRYQAGDNYFGEDRFQYRVQDDAGAWSNDATVVVTISAVNDAPLANPDRVEMDEDQGTTLNLLGNDQDVDGRLDPTSIELKDLPESIRVEVQADGSLQISPAQDFSGEVTFSYRVADDEGEYSDWALITVVVRAQNDAPVAVADRFELDEGGVLQASVTDNDFDVDGDAFSARLVSQPQYGAVTLQSDGGFRYQHDGGEQTQDRFEYQIHDGEFDSAPVTVTLDIRALNDAPVAQADAVSTREDESVAIAVLANDSDADGDPLTVAVTVAPKLGTADVVEGLIHYQPQPNRSGVDSLSYQISDGKGGVATAQVTIEILAVNDAPVANDDVAETAEDQAVSIDVLSNDSDLDGDTLSLSLVSQPARGEVQLSAGQVRYQPEPNDHGEVTFRYAIDDGNGGRDEAQVRVVVVPVNDPPVANDDWTATSVRQPVVIAVLDNDVDVDGDALVVVNASVDYGQVEVLADQTLRFTPQPDRLEASRISYRISDGKGGESSALVQVMVDSDNRAPVAQDDEVILANGQWQARIAVLDNDSDPDGDALTVIGAAGGYGEVMIEANQLVWQGDSNMPGSVIIEYRISDGFGGEDSAIVQLLSDDALRPVVTAPAPVWVDAEALFTKVDLGTATAVDRFGTPLPVSLVDGVPFFQPGENTAFWEACDDEGRCGTAPQKVYVRPLVSLAKDQVVLEGREVEVEVVMNGPHYQYPVVVPYTLSGTVDDSEHTLVEGELLIESGTSALLTFETLEDGVAEADETLVVHLDPSVNPGNKRDHQVTITEGNLPPELALSAAQDGEPRLVASQELGMMVIAATLTDPNAGDQHQWQWHHDSILADLDVTEERFEFDPAEVDPGLYTLTVEAWDQAGLTDITSITIEVVAALAPLEPGADSDGDLIPDLDEGYVDRDFDGIPDYRDQVVDECNVLPETGDNWDGYIVEADPAVCLRIGRYTTNGASGGAQVLAQDIGTARNDLVEDTEATNVGGIFDFIAYKLPEAGQSVQVVLPQRLAIPANAVYRKFLPEEGWVTLNEDGDNRLHSAPGEPGFCPPPGGDVWTPGLNEGHWCVQVTLEDGGRYDADALRNGSVTDPGGVAVMLNNNRPPLANGDVARVRDGKRIVIPVLDNDSDPDVDPLRIVAVSAALGEVSINDDQTLDYRAPVGYLGADTLSYSISDGQGGSAQANVAVDVYLNRGPLAVNDVAELYNNDTALVSVMSNDSDADGDTLQLVSASVDIGSVTVEANGQLRYQPPQDYIGPALATYTITDGEGGEASAEVQFSVLGKQLVKTEGGSSGSLNAIGLALLALLALGRRRVLPWLALVLGASAPALAEEKPLDPLKPWFVTGNLSWASSDVSTSDLNRDLADAGLNAQVLSLDKERLGWGVGLGYRVTERWFVEAGYLNIDEVDLTIEGVFQDPATFFDAVEHVYPESGHGPYAQLGYRLPLSERWGLTGKVGAFFWEGDYESVALNTGMGTGSDNPDGTDLLYGVTLDYRVSRDWLASLQLQRVEFDRYPAMLLGFNLSYHFGGSAAPAPVLAPVPVDSDGDGVIDPQDACPDTPMTHAVDGRGCTLWRAEAMELELVLLFANDSATIPATYDVVLQNLSEQLAPLADYQVVIEGHASAPASSRYNLSLSERRAQAVGEALNQRGVESANITYVARGEEMPAVAGNTEQAYGQNRRAVVMVSFTEKTPVPRP